MKKLYLLLALACPFTAFAQFSANVTSAGNVVTQTSTQSNATGGQGGTGGVGVGGNANALSQGSQSSSGGNSMSSTYDRAASSAIAPALAAGSHTCLGSKTAAAQFIILGGSGGTTIPDEECDMREDALTMGALGYPEVAVAIMCAKPRVAFAMQSRGFKCPTKE